jgi:hypothetical protein
MNLWRLRSGISAQIWAASSLDKWFNILDPPFVLMDQDHLNHFIQGRESNSDRRLFELELRGWDWRGGG